MRILALISVIVSLGFAVRSQSILSSFDIGLSQGNVLLAWTIKSGSTCNGMQVFRSQDSVNFVLIEDIQGVCGSLSSSVSYTFTDHTPILNAFNYYKIDFGGQEQSSILGIEVINVLSNSFVLRPNPVTGASDLYFENDNQNEVVLKVFEDFGDVIYKSQTNSNKFVLDSTSFSDGLYYFSLENMKSRNIINGKAVIVNQ